MQVNGEGGRRRLKWLPAWQAIAVLAVAGSLSFLPAWQSIERLGFDLLTVTFPPEHEDFPLVVVGIDEPSFAELGMAWPWPRGMHGRLVEALDRAGAAVVAFDVVFADPTTRDQDQAFAEAIQRHGNVVLAGDLFYQQDPRFEQVVRVDPLGRFLEAGAATGIASVTVDSDLVVRRLPAADDAFWREIVRAWNRSTEAQTAGNPDLPAGALIRYLPPGVGFSYASYYQAVEGEGMLPPGFFRDKIVLVGLNLKASPEPGKAGQDQFATPFLGSTGWLTPGVELVAVEVANGLMNRHVTAAPAGLVLMLSALSLALALRLMWAWQPLRSGLVAVAIMLALGMVSAGLFSQWDYWLPVFAPALAVVGYYLLRGGTAFAVERQRRRAIRQAFEHYVPPSVVSELLHHPELLSLGGERRPITVMFTDLAGFTNEAEKLEPEAVSGLLNEHFDAMASIVIDHGGTIDKFIGDAIMAFWGAPLEDEKQALHACEAALAMQQGMRQLRESLRRRRLPELRMRIGVHTGEAVVGNMGASARFDYTAVGDTVNLASRLEGVNKLYGTELLVTEDVTQQLEGCLPLYPLDIIRVKGKQQPVEIFTAFGDATLGEQVAGAVALFRERRWADAMSQWRSLANNPAVAVIAELYIRRLEEINRAPPAADWDGAYALEKM